MLLQLFPELEHLLPPNDFDSFRSENDAWKRENYHKFFKNKQTESDESHDALLENLLNNEKGNLVPYVFQSHASESAFLDESFVIRHLSSDALWLGKYGSPFVESEKSYFEE